MTRTSSSTRYIVKHQGRTVLRTFSLNQAKRHASRYASGAKVITISPVQR